MANIDRKQTLIISIDDPVGAPETMSARLVIDQVDTDTGETRSINKTFPLSGSDTAPNLTQLKETVARIIAAARDA